MVLSTAESKCDALVDVTRIMVFLRVLEFLQPGQQRGPVTVLEDGDGVIKSAGRSHLYQRDETR